MDTDWRPTQGSDPANAGGVAVGVDLNAPAPALAGGDWRAELLPESRGRIINKIVETLKNQLPASTPDALLNDLPRVSALFEEKIYNLATDLPDYLRKISLKMLYMENRAQRAREIAPVIRNANNPGPAPALPSHGGNQPQPAAIPLMPQRQAQKQNIYASVQAYPLTNIRQSFPGVNQSSMLQNVSGMPQNTMNNGLPQGASQNIYAAQRQIAGWQQQQHQSHNQLIYQQQQMLMRQNLQQGSLIQPHIQQRQFIQAPRGLQQVSSSTSVDSTARTGHAGADDWREEIYQMIKSLKDQHFAELSELYNKISVTVHRVDGIMPPQQGYESMRRFKLLLERIFHMLHLNRSNIQHAMRDMIPLFEKQIWNILSAYRRRLVPTIGRDVVVGL